MTITAPTSNLIEAADDEAALEWLHAQGCTDGLPVVIPTQARVERMILASGLDGSLSLGSMGPGNGATTISAIATNAVMAGCEPDYMPVVVAIIQAILKPEFDLTEMQGTTHSTAPLAIINGPIRSACSIESGFGALGPGFRANASIGRAVRLVMMNVGMARPGESDMALLGHPGKFSYCLAEAEEASPWEPHHTSLGYFAEQSAVTVVGAEAPHNVVFVADADDPDSPERLLRSLAAVLANLGSNNSHFGGGAQVVVLNPDHADVLHDAGMSRRDVQERLVELATNSHEAVAQLNPTFAGKPGSTRQALRSADDVIVIVAGGVGLYSVVMPSWAAGGHMNSIVHNEIITDLSCEIPFAQT